MTRSIVLLGALFRSVPALAQEHGPTQVELSVCFTPAEHCTPKIIDAIRSAKSEIRVQAYGFTSPPILAALTAAKQRGLDVQVILDKSNDRAKNGRSRYTGATFMANASVPVWIDYRPSIAHNKLIIIDRHLVMGGSFNYTAAAEKRNAENVTFTESTAVAGLYLENWRSRQAASRVFEVPE